MGEIDFWFYVCVFLVFIIVYLFFLTARIKRKLKTVYDKPAFTRVSTDSIQETRNIVRYLLDREADLGLLDNVNNRNYEKILHIDKSAFKKAAHPGLLAAVRAAHLAGYTISVRMKGKESEEREANSSGMILEHVSKVESGKERRKKEKEMRMKKDKYGYYK